MPEPSWGEGQERGRGPNYQTYTIHHLRRITKLDCLLVTDDRPWGLPSPAVAPTP